MSLGGQIVSSPAFFFFFLTVHPHTASWMSLLKEKLFIMHHHFFFKLLKIFAFKQGCDYADCTSIVYTALHCCTKTYPDNFMVSQDKFIPVEIVIFCIISFSLLMMSMSNKWYRIKLFQRNKFFINNIGI